jgi:uncharacterized protein YggE
MISQKTTILFTVGAALVGILLGSTLWRSPVSGQGIFFGSTSGSEQTARASLQQAGENGGLPSHTISVSGTGETQAKPDLAFVSVGVVTESPTAEQAQQENSAKMTAVIDAVKNLKIDAADIQTSALNLQPVYSNSPRPSNGQPQIVGYRATSQIRVRVKDIAKTGSVLDESVKAGANTGGNVRFGIADDDELSKQALKNAVQDARGKADAMAAALGVTITGVHSISEGSLSMPVAMQESFRADLAAAPAAGTPVEPGELKITAQVRVVYTY